MGFIEAIIKPAAKQFVRNRVLTHAPAVLALMDERLPEFLRSCNGEELGGIIKMQLEHLTGESWSNAEVDEVFKLYDVRITADTLRKHNEEHY